MSIIQLSGPAQHASLADHRGPARLGYAIIILTFGVLGGWAAVAPLGSAVMASGVVTAEMNRKTVQHFEGGIVREILVREGQEVQQGQTLFKLDDTQSKASFEINANQAYAASARVARLSAESEGAEEIAFPDELIKNRSNPVVERAIQDQTKEFTERRASLSGQISILNARQDQLRREIDGLNQQKGSAEAQVGYINSELVGLRELLNKSLIPKTRVFAMERERSRLDGEIGRLQAEVARSEKAIGESDLQVQQIKQQFQEQLSKDLAETRERLADLRNKLLVAQDILSRLVILAPTSGIVQNLRVFTLGAVIRPGEPLLDISPGQDKLVVQAHVSPLDMESMGTGRVAEIRFPVFHDRTMPMIRGTVESLSGDRLVDEATKQPYFLAIITVKYEDMAEVYREKLKPGMNAEVIIPIKERTALQYIAEPLMERIHSSFREK